MLRVAMIDHHLNNFHSDTFLRLFRGPLAGEEVDVAAAWESAPVGEDWCARNGVRRAASPEDAVQGVDAVMVMAPDNVEEHLRFASAVIPAGLPTFVDKFLAPTLDEAWEIAGLARRHGCPLFSSSALRFAVELEAAREQIGRQQVTDAATRGLSHWNLYGCHTVSLALGLMGAAVRRLSDTGTETARTVTLDYGDERRAVVDVRTAANEWDVFGWWFAGRAGDRYVAAAITDFEGFYANLMRQAAAFMKSGKAPFSVEDALTMVAILEGADRSRALDGAWVPISVA